MKSTVIGLSVNTYGNPENQPVVLIHGFPYDHTMWENQIEALKENYFCVAYDVRGLGESYAGDGQYMMEFFVDDLFAVIKELKLNKPVICGLSMGGYIALRAVERQPEMFAGMILCDTRSEADDNTGKIKRAENINVINTEGLKKFCDQFVTNTFAPETPAEKEELYLSVLQKTYTQNPVGVKGSIIAIGSRTDTTQSLSQIKIPTLVLVGSFDKLTPPVVMRNLAENIPGSEFGIIPRAGHMSPLENPDAVNDLIIGFLKRRIK